MGSTVFDISMSLDGLVNRSLLERSVTGTGAVICGRRTYDHSVSWWEADGPTGPARLPVFVVTHEAPAQSPANGVYHFVTDGIESALKQARAAAGGKGVTIMGGADLGRQYLAAGLVDELSIHLVPVLFGSGTRMFGDLPDGHLRLEGVEALSTPSANHLRYRIVR